MIDMMMCVVTRTDEPLDSSTNNDLFNAKYTKMTADNNPYIQRLKL